jgi:cellulose biosynthesis protein BcsQ
VVVAVDLDPQGSLTRALLSEHGRVDDNGRLGEVIKQKRILAEALERRLSDPSVPIDEFLKHGVGPTGSHYSLLPNEATAWDVERRRSKRPGEAKLKAVLSRLIEDLAKRYDYVIIDCPPGQTVLAEAAITSSDLIICPITPDWLSYWGLESFDNYLRDVFQCNETDKQPAARFVFTKFRRKPPKYDPQNKIYEFVEAFGEPERCVTLLREPGEKANTSGGPISLPLDPKLASRLEGWPNTGRVWPWSRIYTSATQSALLKLVAGMKKDLDRG